MQNQIPRLLQKLRYPRGDTKHRYMIVSHLFDDTRRMLRALGNYIDGYDAIVGIPYSSCGKDLEPWYAEFGPDRIHVPEDLPEMETVLLEQLDRSLRKCQQEDQNLIVQECGGFVVPLLHQHFDASTLAQRVAGVVEITKQGVWRSQAVPNLQFPVLHCANSEIKRLEAKRCGETVARCLDGVVRDLGMSLAGRKATVFGAGWIGSGVAEGLSRLDMTVAMVDVDPLKVMEARLNGFVAHTDLPVPELQSSDLVVGATGRLSITRDVLNLLPDSALVASASSRQIEIDTDYLFSAVHERQSLGPSLDRYTFKDNGSSVLLINNGFPVNFLPGSGSVPDEIVETVLGELLVLMKELVVNGERMPAGVNGMSPHQEKISAETWLDLRDDKAPSHGSAPLQPEYSQTPLNDRMASRCYSSVRTSSPESTAGTASETDTDANKEASKAEVHSPYLVQRLTSQEKPNLYGTAKFAIVSEQIRRVFQDLDRPVRLLDLGCSTTISKQYLEAELCKHSTPFEYCGVDYEAAFAPDIVMDVREIYRRREDLPWVPDVIMLLDVLEHLPGKERDIAQVMEQCNQLLPKHGRIFAVVPQLYRLDRLKLSHLHYQEHQVRLALDEWYKIIAPTTKVVDIHGIGYLSCLPYLPMMSPWYQEDNLHGDLVRYLRGHAFEWAPLKPLEVGLTQKLGKVVNGWCNSSLFICERKQ